MEIPDIIIASGNADYTISGTKKSTDETVLGDVEKAYDDWKSKKEPAYDSSYRDDIKKALSELEKREFSYDPEKDEAYLRYRDSVKNSAELALANALGIASNLNGGYATSYAQTAGQSAYVNAMKAADEKLPDFYEDAFDRYKSETDQLEDRLNILTDLDEDEWDRYIDMLDEYTEEGEDILDRLTELSNEEFDRFYAMYKLSVK